MKECSVVVFKDHNSGIKKWSCQNPKFLVSTAHVIERKHCTYHRCPGREEISKEQMGICAWRDCQEPIAPNKVRHCSEVCRNRSNRDRYRQRQKQKRAQNAAVDKATPK